MNNYRLPSFAEAFPESLCHDRGDQPHQHSMEHYRCLPVYTRTRTSTPRSQCTEEQINGSLSIEGPRKEFGHKTAYKPRQVIPGSPCSDDHHHNHHHQQQQQLSTDSKEEMVSLILKDMSQTVLDRSAVKEKKGNSNSKEAITGAYTCDMCFNYFFTKADLERHVQRHGRKQFACDRCDAQFTQRPHLITHIQVVHNNLRQFSCKQCSKSFGTHSNLRRHVKIVHEKVKKYSCEDCGSGFVQRSDYRVHLTRVHRYSVAQLKQVLDSA